MPVNNRNAAQEQELRASQAMAYQAPYLNQKTLLNQLPNPSFINKWYYYDSPVTNGHQYPNLYHIGPVEFNDPQSSPYYPVNMSIEQNKQFPVGGGHYVPIKPDIKHWN